MKSTSRAFKIYFLRLTRRSLSTENSSAPKPVKKLDSQKGVLQFIDPGTGAGATRTGRAWRTSELRLKSYEDLHKLWFILLKERNILLSEKAWCKTNGRHWVNGPSNLYKVKRSMARLKGVVGERTRAFKAKRAREALLAERDGLGLKDAVAPPSSTSQGVVTRTLPSN